MKPSIKEFRLRKGLTQEQAAKKIGIAISSYQRIEYGTQRPSLKTAFRTADVLGVENLRDLWTPTATGK